MRRADQYDLSEVNAAFDEFENVIMLDGFHFYDVGEFKSYQKPFETRGGPWDYPIPGWESN